MSLLAQLITMRNNNSHTIKNMKPQEKVNLIIKEAEDAIEQVMGNRVVLLLSQGNKIINRLNIDAVIAAAAEIYNVTPAAIRGKGRRAELVRIRMFISYYCIRDRRAASYSAVGRAMGGRDHATIINHVKNMENYLECYKEFIYDYRAFCVLINEALKFYQPKNHQVNKLL